MTPSSKFTTWPLWYHSVSPLMPLTHTEFDLPDCPTHGYVTHYVTQNKGNKLSCNLKYLPLPGHLKENLNSPQATMQEVNLEPFLHFQETLGMATAQTPNHLLMQCGQEVNAMSGIRRTPFPTQHRLGNFTPASSDYTHPDPFLGGNLGHLGRTATYIHP